MLQRLAASSAPSHSHQGLLALVVVSYDEDTGRVELRQGSQSVGARVDATVDPIVVRGALARSERVIAQREEDELVVVGALRTAATPGQDVGDDYVIEARRVILRGQHEVAMSSGESSFVLRAIGRIEVLSRNISSRARGIQKLIARVIELN